MAKQPSVMRAVSGFELEVIAGLSGACCCILRVAADWTVRRLKDEIAFQQGTGIAEQMLLLGSRILGNTEKLGALADACAPDCRAAVTLVRQKPMLVRGTVIKTTQLECGEWEVTWEADLRPLRRTGKPAASPIFHVKLGSPMEDEQGLAFRLFLTREAVALQPGRRPSRQQRPQRGGGARIPGRDEEASERTLVHVKCLSDPPAASSRLRVSGSLSIDTAEVGEAPLADHTFVQDFATAALASFPAAELTLSQLAPDHCTLCVRLCHRP